MPLQAHQSLGICFGNKSAKEQFIVYFQYKVAERMGLAPNALYIQAPKTIVNSPFILLLMPSLAIV